MGNTRYPFKIREQIAYYSDVADADADTNVDVGVRRGCWILLMTLDISAICAFYLFMNTKSKSIKHTFFVLIIKVLIVLLQLTCV